MCQKDYIKSNKENKGFKYKHLNYTERTMIERWYNIDKKAMFGDCKIIK
jgi:hypothetical protein